MKKERRNTLIQSFRYAFGRVYGPESGKSEI